MALDHIEHIRCIACAADSTGFQVVYQIILFGSGRGNSQ